MALTSKEVVQRGGQVAAQVQTLAEKMTVFQRALDSLDSHLDDMSQGIESCEEEIKLQIDRLGESIRGQWNESASSMGETIVGSVLEPARAALESFDEKLEAQFTLVTSSNTLVLEQWQDWREAQVSSLMDNLNELSVSNQSTLDALTVAVTEDTSGVVATIEAYENSIATETEQLTEYLESEIVSSFSDSTESYSTAMGDFTASLTDVMSSANETLLETQSSVTGAMFSGMLEQFAELVKSELFPLIDAMIEAVSNAVNEMMEKIIAIGNESGERSKSLDIVSDMLKGLLEPIRESIGRLEGIKDTVGGFL